MGVFWRITQGNYVPVETLILKETTGTLSGAWPFLWRFGQYYYLLELQDGRYAKGYYVFTHSEEDRTLRFHCLSHTRFLMVRVGPEPKRVWVETHLPMLGRKCLILSHRKDLNRGRFLIDDRAHHGAISFGDYDGQEWIHFGHGAFSEWSQIVDYLMS